MPDWGDGLPGDLGGWDAGDWGDGLPLGPAATPKVVSAVMLSCQLLRITFDVEMEHSDATSPTDVLNEDNYSFTGPTDVVINTIILNQANPTIVDLYVNTTSVDGFAVGVNNYQVTVENVKSITGAEIAGKTANFSGVNCQAGNFIAEILIGDSVVWSSQVAIAEQNLNIDVSQWNGIERLKFRVRGLT